MTETIMITGASRGIGLEFVRQYAADGARVIAACRNPGGAEGLRAVSGDIEPLALDVTDAESVAAARSQLGDRPIDVLINNAGIYGPRGGSFDDIDFEAWREVLEVNGLAPMRVLQAFAGNVAASARGRVVTISSIMGSIGGNAGGGEYIYRSSKAMVNAVMRSAALDLAARGIITVMVHPGWVQTDMGGPSAAITPSESVAGLRQVIAGLDAAANGRFFNYDGGELPW